MTDAPSDNRMTASAMKVPELKPCPFCGYKRPGMGMDDRTVACYVCGADGPLVLIKKDRHIMKREASIKWNQRASDPGEGCAETSTEIPAWHCPWCASALTDAYTFEHESITIKPCPFCGSQKTNLVADSSRCKVAFRVSCAKCHASARIIKRDGKPDFVVIREAYTSWNMRASDSVGDGQ